VRFPGRIPFKDFWRIAGHEADKPDVVNAKNIVCVRAVFAEPVVRQYDALRTVDPIEPGSEPAPGNLGGRVQSATELP
jgi:hypothetical protein